MHPQVQGRSEEAVHEAEAAVESMPISTDYLEGANPIWWKVLTLGQAGAVDEPPLDRRDAFARSASAFESRRDQLPRALPRRG